MSLPVRRTVARQTVARRTVARLTVVAALVGPVLGLGLVLAPPADAMTKHTRQHLVAVAAAKKGSPYKYGAAGPRKFDCSGLVLWVFAKVGRDLPHNSQAQRDATHDVPADERRLGDLVFFKSHGRVYHVGIYAGGNKIWHAPRPGRKVSRERIWTTHVVYGRVR